VQVNITLLSLMALATFIGSFVQGATGLGFALIAAPAIGLIDPRLLPVTILVLMIPLNSFVALREWSAIDFRGVSWVMVGRVVGTVGGLWVLVSISSSGLSLFVGLSTIAAALVSLAMPAFEPSKQALLAVGAITGITETATGIGGPPLALAYQHRPAPELRSTLAVCFLLGEIISLALLAASDKVEWRQIQLTFYLIPVMALGVLLSTRVHGGLNGPLVRKFVLGFALVSGIAIVVRGL
jgi:uncharacterized membrane protein YfcA